MGDHQAITLDPGVTGVRIVARMTDCVLDRAGYSAIIQNHQAPVCDQAASILVAERLPSVSQTLIVDSVQLRNAVSARGEPQGLLAV